MKRQDVELIAGGFAMAEGPRWRDNAVILNDIHAQTIERIDSMGVVSTLLTLPSAPISTCFLQDGTMLISGLTAQCIWRVSDGSLEVHANLSGVSEFNWGDLVVDYHDRVYIANQGMCYPDNIPDPIDSTIYLLTDGRPIPVAGDFRYANGLAVSPDGRHLIVAESFGHRLWRLPIRDDGSLGERTLIVQFPAEDRPDGICCDAESAVWSANATGRVVVRCTPDGQITDRISTGDDLAIGCILGGPDGRDLFIVTAPTADRQAALRQRGSALWRARVSVPSGGRP
jgi:sugar lactone lactonase YvrE